MSKVINMKNIHEQDGQLQRLVSAALNQLIEVTEQQGRKMLLIIEGEPKREGEGPTLWSFGNEGGEDIEWQYDTLDTLLTKVEEVLYPDEIVFTPEGDANDAC